MEMEVCGWSRIPDNARVVVGFFCPIPSLEVQLQFFLHHTPKLGIPVEMVQFFFKLIETENSCCVQRFSLSASCCEIVDSQTSFVLC